MPMSSVAGRPLHPMWIVAPAALIPFGLILGARYRKTGKESASNAAYSSLTGVVAASVATGAAVYLLARKNERDRTSGSLALSVLAAASGLVSGWIGGRMAYGQGTQSEDKNSIENPAQLKLFEEGFEHTLLDSDSVASVVGPVMP